ncbi:MAG: transcription-repair coupling factor [Verrucomicrobiota bacterium]
MSRPHARGKAPPPAGRLQPGALVRQAESSKAFLRKLGPLAPTANVFVEQIAPAAHAFVVAVILSRIESISPIPQTSRIWLACPDLRTQERLSNELPLWSREALFLPECEVQEADDTLPDPDIYAERLGVLNFLTSGPSPSAPVPIILLQTKSFHETVPNPRQFQAARLTLRPRETHPLPQLQQTLVESGYERTPQVIARGQFAVRGEIVDVFSWQAASPARFQFFDNDIEAIREFDIDSQVSTRSLVESQILLAEAAHKNDFSLHQYVATQSDFLIVIDPHEDDAGLPDSITPSATIYSGSRPDATVADYSCACHENPLGGFDAGDFILQEAKRKSFQQQIDEWHNQDWTTAMAFRTEGEIERFTELVDTPHLASGYLGILTGQLDHGFIIPEAAIAVVSDTEIFGRYHVSTAQRRFAKDRLRHTSRMQAEFREFDEDDLVVHSDYGIGKFLGLQSPADSDSDRNEDVLVIEYADEAKLYVPINQAHLVSRYVGVGRKAPQLNRLGGNRWNRARERAEKSIMDYAAQLLSIQAERDSAKGFAHAPDTRWQHEFENSFPYKETPDQISAIQETKADMESRQPMDRLICGDVGFGKTEVAIRAAFKAVMSGKQVAILVPTTVLAQQHFQTFRERMSEYPFSIELLSRFRTKKEQTKVAKLLREGGVDIVIGTHRLISKDIAFKNLGLVVIDEEQRFGVVHKERFKDLFRLVDVLTLSATPIPRTLYLSLMGARDMSTIDTPPPNRYPVNTVICPYDERVFRAAIERELDRSGQVFFLHNRVGTIEKIAEKIEDLVPNATVDVGHGQMDEGELELVMHRFIEGETQILVCTTIIESGIDIPNANTIIIDRADRFGLADLYQLRGRVGRAHQKAYAILMLPRSLMTTSDAQKRISAIKQYSSLGAGFKIAMRDLEIRGAGNLLGTQQSGHIVAVGFDLYCQLLRQSVAKLKGDPSARRIDVGIKIDFLSTNEAEYMQQDDHSRIPAFIPANYIEETRLRIQAYRHIAELASPNELEQLSAEWNDRFGAAPTAVTHLLLVAAIRIACAQADISLCEIQDHKLMLTRNRSYILFNGKFPRLDTESAGERLRQAASMIKSF